MAMKRKANTLAWLLTATALGLGSAIAQDGPKADVIHIWVSAGESAAINVVVDQFKKEGGVWLDSAVAGGQNLAPAVMSRIAGGNPPTAYQALAGRAFEDLWEQGLLNDIEATATADNWRAVLPAPLVKIMENDEGKIFLIPLGMHGPNWIWYSTEVLEKSGVTEIPTNFDETFFDALDKVQAAGYIGFVVGKQSFQERFLMETVMLALGGKDYWNHIWGDRDDALVRGDMTRKVFETFRRLSTYADEGAAGRTWPVNTNLLITNKGGFNVMGDWAKGEFKAAGLTALEGLWLRPAGGQALVPAPGGHDGRPGRSGARSCSRAEPARPCRHGEGRAGRLQPQQGFTAAPYGRSARGFRRLCPEGLRLVHRSGTDGGDGEHVLHAEGRGPVGRSRFRVLQQPRPLG